MKDEKTKKYIADGKGVLGIELGSTRIKAVLIGEDYQPVASGSYAWENKRINGIWTYDLKEIHAGLQKCYKELKKNVEQQYGETLTHVAAMGISAMMHGYMVFDKEGKLLVPFRTWRNTITEHAADKLTELFQVNIPQRWSIAHLYQAVLNGEEHISSIDFMTTLSGYLHWKLTGRKVLGIGDAAGMFPVDPEKHIFREEMLDQFDHLISSYTYPWEIRKILPHILTAGEDAGWLTEEGAMLLDPEGDLQPGIKLCPPEGDAGTGMVATNSVKVRTGNISAGTSVFAMLVLEKEMKQLHREIDLVATPSGSSVAMVHCNNCTSDLNAWVNLFHEFLEGMKISVTMDELYQYLYNEALKGEKDGGGLLSYCYYSGEHITGLMEGRPLFVRKSDSHFTLANFMRTNLYTSLGALKIGLSILLEQEKMPMDHMVGHGGLFKTPKVGQQFVAAAINAPVIVMDTAGEGGAWGSALLAAYLLRGECRTLEDFLEEQVFAGKGTMTVYPEAEDVEGFDKFLQRYIQGLKIEETAVLQLQ